LNAEFVSRFDIRPGTTFGRIRGDLQKPGFENVEYPDVISAKKRDISIFTVETANKIERIEGWCG
jgi:hypothetical protein